MHEFTRHIFLFCSFQRVAIGRGSGLCLIDPAESFRNSTLINSSSSVAVAFGPYGQAARVRFRTESGGRMDDQTGRSSDALGPERGSGSARASPFRDARETTQMLTRKGLAANNQNELPLCPTRRHRRGKSEIHGLTAIGRAVGRMGDRFERGRPCNGARPPAACENREFTLVYRC
jgi:hypothetical protein